MVPDGSRIAFGDPESPIAVKPSRTYRHRLVLLATMYWKVAGLPASTWICGAHMRRKWMPGPPSMQPEADVRAGLVAPEAAERLYGR